MSTILSKTHVILLCICMVVFATHISYSQDCAGAVQWKVDPITGTQGETKCINVVVDNFTDIASASFSINFNTQILEYVTESLTSDFVEVRHGENLANTGVIRVLYFPTSSCESLPNNTNLFELCFDLVGPPGSTTDISLLGSTGIPIEIITGCSVTENTNFICEQGGEVEILCDGGIQIDASVCNSNGPANDGVIRFRVCGGLADYTFTVDDPTNKSGTIGNNEYAFVNNLPAGTYTINIRDNSGATSSMSYTINDNGSINLDNSVATDPSCANGNRPDGSIEINPTGGQGDYHYSWEFLDISETVEYNVNTFMRLDNGRYRVTVSDEGGCEVTEEFTLNVEPITLDFDIFRNPVCEGSTRFGAVDFAITGGAPFDGGRYDFKWKNEEDANFRPLNREKGDFIRKTQVEGGTITVVVIDSSFMKAAGCEPDTIEIDIPYDKELSLTVDATAGSCAGNGEGIASVSITNIGGSAAPDYTYALLDTMENALPTPIGGMEVDPDFDISNLNTGTYIIEVTDADNCSAQDTIEIAQGTSIGILETQVSDPDCTNGGNSGIISVDGDGGTRPYRFEWRDDPTIESNQRTDLSATTYEVRAIDDTGCMSEYLSFTLDNGGSIAIDAVIVNNIRCAGEDNGSVTIQASGADITYDWGNGPTNENTQTGLSAGSYSVVISQGPDCTVNQNFEIQEPSPLSLMYTETPPSCADTQDGALTVSPIGGTGSTYTYSWNYLGNPQGTVLDNIPSGDYEVTVMDSVGCTYLETITLAPVTKLDVSLSNVVGISCGGGSTGSAQATINSGVLGSYTYTWYDANDTEVKSSSDPFNNTLDAGDHYLIVTNGSCTSDQVPFTIESNYTIVADPDGTTMTMPSCNGNSDGTITVTATGGVPPYDYNWVAQGVAGQTISNLSAGMYEVSVTDGNNCGNIVMIELQEPDVFEADIDMSLTKGVNCSENNDGEIHVTTTGGNPGINTYEWTDNISDRSFATNLGIGSYEIMVTDINGCPDRVIFDITAPDAVNVEYIIPDSPACFGDRAPIRITSVSGGPQDANYTYSISKGNSLPIDSVSMLFPGDYTLSVFAAARTFVCQVDTVITINSQQELLVELGPTQAAELGIPKRLIANTSSFNPIVAYNWSPPLDVECLDEDCINVNVSPSIDTEYIVEVIDSAGCTAVDEVLITVDKDRSLYFPNAFNPSNPSNADNREFTIFPSASVEMIENLVIYDRFGNEIKNMDQLFPDPRGIVIWDGKKNNDIMETGVYAYALTVRFVDQRVLAYSGTVTLLR